MSARTRFAAVLAAVLVVYFVVLAITGKQGWLHQHAPIGIILVGVVFGAVTALGAMGLILIYRANRFINFGYGAMGSFVGVISIGLVLQHGWPYFVALPVAVVAGGVVGALTEFLIIRRFRTASRGVITVASIGLAQLFGGLELIGSKAIGFTALAGGFKVPIDFSLRIDVYTFHGDELLMVIAVPIVIAFLAWFLLRTDAGIAVRAAAENHDRALLFGIPVRRLWTIVWALSGALAALTYMLQAPFEGVKPGLASNGPTVLLPLLAAAVLARMESLPEAFGWGIGLGIIEQLVHWDYPNKPTAIYLVYLVLIVVALLLQRGKISRALVGGDATWVAATVVKPIPSQLRRLPEVRWVKVAAIALVVAAFIYIPYTWGATNQLLAGFAIVWAIVAVSMVVLFGWGGHISLGQFAIAGIAGMVAANMISHWNADLLLVIVASALVGALAALILGLPALRIKGLFLAVTTLAFAVCLDEYVLNENNFPKAIPGAFNRPMLWQRFDLEHPYVMYAVCVAFLGLSVLAVHGIRKARAGRVLIGTNDNERAADAAAVPTTAVKLSGFMIAGAICGIAGALDVLLLHALSPGAFPAIDSITVYAYGVIGGLGSITGTLIGVLLFKYLETVTALGDIRELLNGTVLLIVLWVLPGGLGQLFFTGRDRLLRIVAARRNIVVPSLIADKRTPDDDHAADETDLLAGALEEPVGAGR